MKKANYTYQVDGDILFIEDNGGIAPSVTNAIESVLTDIEEELKTSISNYKVIYRDSEGTIDGVMTKDGFFTNFYHIGEDNYHSAKLKVKPNL